MNLKQMTVKDSRGRESKTLFFVAVSWLVVLIKFILGGLSIFSLGELPIMTGSEFGIATGAVLAIWTGREYVDKKIDYD